MKASLRARDQKLVQIVDTALADAAQRSGDWLVCRPGCTQCCLGPFAINQLDAARLRQGLAELQISEPEKARRIRGRARDYVRRIASDFPGNTKTGILGEGAEAEARFARLANDEPCPALDPATGLCELYAHRPITCRTFGPPVRSGDEGGLGVCELCYHGASDEQIAACEMIPDPDGIEAGLVKAVDKSTGVTGNTIVAFCLLK